jgi:hypothetical protein
MGARSSARSNVVSFEAYRRRAGRPVAGLATRQVAVAGGASARLSADQLSHRQRMLRHLRRVEMLRGM